MALLSPGRLTISEYGAPRRLSADAEELGLSAGQLRDLLERAGVRLEATVVVKAPLQISGDWWSVQDVAGLVRLSPTLELEIVPKFLHPDDPTWREDFFAVATLVRFGRILPREALRASQGKRGDLADLIGHALCEMYDRNRARPLWVYRRREWNSFEIEGEIEPESVFLPEEDGFAQSDIRLDRQNTWNWAIHQAMQVLLPEVKSGDVRRKLGERRAHLSPQNVRPRSLSKRLLPSRHRRWQNLYDLSLSVLDGFGVALSPGSALAPGYVLKTADAWEALLLMALRSGLPECEVAKRPHDFGVRETLRADGTIARSRAAQVMPDATIVFPDGFVLPVDAKYKGRFTEGTTQPPISATDLYESVAFMSAMNVARIVLIYPQRAQGSVQTGHAVPFEQILVEGKKVIGVTLDVRGIAKGDGFRRFASGSAEIANQLRA
ncbi:MAG TPA: hypothetical protein VF627_08405 [Abditibacterium sp.]|jgi:hypothetical protein